MHQHPYDSKVLSKHTTRRSRLLASAAIVAGVALSACGSSNNSASDASAAPGVTAAPASTSPETNPATTEPVVTTTTTTTAPDPNPPIPAGEVSPGTYSVYKFALPMDISVTVPITRVAFPGVEKSVLWLSHDQGALGLDTPTSREFIVTVGEVTRVTPAEQAVRSFCNVLDPSANPTPTTLFGGPAFSIEVLLTEDCAPGFGTGDGGTFVVLAGRVLRVVAADVNGQAVMVFADAPKSLWPDFSKEVDALLASMQVPH